MKNLTTSRRTMYRMVLGFLCLLPLGLAQGQGVGIGTTNPLSKLHVVGDALLEGGGPSVLTLRKTGMPGDFGLSFRNSANNYIWYLHGDSITNHLVFAGGSQPSLSALSEILRINNLTGLTGLRGDLELLRHSNTAQLLTRRLSLGGIRSSNGSPFGEIQFINHDNDGSSQDYVGASIRAVNGSGTDGGDLRFMTQANLNGLGLRMLIDGEGRIGINQSNPIARLDIVGDQVLLDTTRSALTIRTMDNTRDVGIAFRRSGANYAWNMYRSSTDDLLFSSGATSNINDLTDRVRFKLNGTVEVINGPLNILAGGVYNNGNARHTGSMVVGSGNAPQATLDVYGSGVFRNTTSGTDISLALDPVGNTKWEMINQGFTGNLILKYSGATPAVPIRFTPEGKVLINTGTPATGYELSVGGKIMAEGIRVQLYSDWPDYVFADEYVMPTLEELRTYIGEHHHLPSFPPARVMEAEGIDLGATTVLQQEWLEVTTRYILEQENRIDQLEAIVLRQTAQIEALIQMHNAQEPETREK